MTSTTDYDKKLKELRASNLRDVSPDGEIRPMTFRVQRVFAKGFEKHKLLLVCLDSVGYWSLHYNQKGI